MLHIEIVLFGLVFMYVASKMIDRHTLPPVDSVYNQPPSMDHMAPASSSTGTVANGPYAEKTE